LGATAFAVLQRVIFRGAVGWKKAGSETERKMFLEKMKIWLFSQPALLSRKLKSKKR
jgi:hypothetical protein